MCAIHKMNFGASDGNIEDGLPSATCNCLLIEANERLVLVDSGLGLLEIDTLKELSERIADDYSIPIDPNLAAARQLPLRGYSCDDVKEIILTHLDLDHAGGLKDFPNAVVYLSLEEYAVRHNPRYMQNQFKHCPKWKPVLPSANTWFGLEARNVAISDEVEIKLIPLPGHTMGHCGVAVREKQSADRWLLHIGDAYYHYAELFDQSLPLDSMASISAADNDRRLVSLAKIRQLHDWYPDEIDVVSSHDCAEIPKYPETWRNFARS